MIDRCFKCDGEGTKEIANWTSVDWGSVPIIERVTCPRCLGSGALDYRIVEISRIEVSPIQEKTDDGK